MACFDDKENGDIPSLSTEQVSKYNDIMYEYSDNKNLVLVENYIDEDNEFIAKMCGISIEETEILRKIVELKRLVNRFNQLVKDINFLKGDLLSSPSERKDMLSFASEEAEDHLGNITATLDALNLIESSNASQVNYIIFPSSDAFYNMVETLYARKSGNDERNKKKISRIFRYLMLVQYEIYKTVKDLLHKIKDKTGSDLRLTSYNILMERISMNGRTKVAFCKLPLSLENKELLKDKLNNPFLDSLYFVTGFGVIIDSGYSELEVYKSFMDNSDASEEILQELADLVSNPLGTKELDYLLRLIEENQKLIEQEFGKSLSQGV